MRGAMTTASPDNVESEEVMHDNSRVLVTGGAGFIGSHIAEHLADAGRLVRVLDDFSTGSRRTARFLQEKGNGRIEIVEGDICDPRTVRDAMEGVTEVIHQAALPSVQRSVEDPVRTNEVGVTGTLLLLEEARRRGVRRFVYAGSSSVYGDQPELPKRESMAPKPLSPYALTKLTGEFYCTQYSSLFGLPTVTLRYFNVFGPRQNPDSQYAAVIPLFIRALKRGERPTIFGDGRQTRDFTYVENVVRANMLALEVGADRVAGCVINVACGERTSLLELLDMISAVTGAVCNPVFEDARAGDVRDSLAAVEEARERLGYSPGISLEEGLRRTADWMSENRDG